MTEDHKQVTVGFKVSAMNKKEIEAAAKRVGVDTSTYLRDMLLGGHDKVKRFTALPDALVIDQHYIGQISNDLMYLKKKYPDRSYSSIISAALQVAVDNEKRVVSNKIKNYLP